MSVVPPDEPLRKALLRLGDQGDRAQQFLDSAAKHLNDPGTDPMATHHAAYALREALTSIVALGGAPPRGMRDAADNVVRRFETAGTDANPLADSIRKLADVVRGPGPNAVRVERALSGLAGLPPTRASADLITRFIVALDTCNEWTHAPSPRPPPDVVALYEEVTTVLRDLFGPMSERLAAMDDLVGHPAPGPAEVELLRRRLGDERHLLYLFDRADGPGWFRALRDDPLLLPPADKPWVAGAYVARIAHSDPDEVRSWLAQSLPTDVNAKQAAELLRIARLASGDVSDIALALARDHLDSPNVRVQVDALLRELAPELRGTREARSLMQGLLSSTLAERGGSHDAYMAAEQLSLAIAAAQGPNAAAWLKMLAHRARETAEADEPLRLRVLLPLSELTLSGARRPLELASAAVRRAAVAAADAGVPLGERLDLLRIVPQPLADRLVAQHLLDGLPDTDSEARAFISGQVATNVQPSPEELALLRRLLDDAGSVAASVARDFAVALGVPPRADDIDALASADDVPADLVRAHRWLVAIPLDATPEWHAADERLGTYLGHASPDGVMMRPPRAGFFGAASPIGPDQLANLSPLQAAQYVAAWRPEQPVSFFGPSAEGLAGTLSEAIGADLDAWLSADPVEIAEALRQPIYIAVFIDALRNNAARVADHAERLVALTELVRSQPWPPDDLGVDPLGPQNTWLRPGDAAIELLGRLGQLDALPKDLADRVWAQLADAFEQRGDTNPNVEDHTHDPLGQAINRPSMRALDVAFAIGARHEVPDARLLELLDRALTLDGVDGLHARAIVARRLPWLRQTAPDWFAKCSSRIFGSDAPGTLGPATVDLHVEWGAPFRYLLIEQREAIVAALEREHHEDAARHLLHGLLWKVPGFEPAAVADILVAVGDREVSYAGRWLGWELADADLELDIAPALDLWREFLSRPLPRAAYSGFGWMAINPHIDDDDWLTLTEATIRATSGFVDESVDVAERASRAPADPRAARIIAGLLADDPKPWYLQRIGALGLEVLAAATGDTATELRERLVERGFYEALES
jgi:hypothetical protein